MIYLSPGQATVHWRAWATDRGPAVRVLRL